jgi:hypothetical protein
MALHRLRTLNIALPLLPRSGSMHTCRRPQREGNGCLTGSVANRTLNCKKRIYTFHPTSKDS